MKKRWQKPLSLLLAGLMAASALQLTAFSAAAAQVDTTQQAAEMPVISAGQTVSVCETEYTETYAFYPRTGSYIISVENLYGSASVTEAGDDGDFITTVSWGYPSTVELSGENGKYYYITVYADEVLDDPTLSVCELVDIGSDASFTFGSEAKYYSWSPEFTGVAELCSDADCELRFTDLMTDGSNGNSRIVYNNDYTDYLIYAKNNGEGDAVCEIRQKTEFETIKVREKKSLSPSDSQNAFWFAFTPETDMMSADIRAKTTESGYRNVDLRVYNDEFDNISYSWFNNAQADLFAGNTYYIYASCDEAFDLVVKDQYDLGLGENKEITYRENGSKLLTYRAEKDGRNALIIEQDGFSEIPIDVTVAVTISDSTGLTLASARRTFNENMPEKHLFFEAKKGVAYSVTIDMQCSEQEEDMSFPFTVTLAEVTEAEQGVRYNTYSDLRFMVYTAQSDCVLDCNQMCWLNDSEQQVNMPRAVKKGDVISALTSFFIVNEISDTISLYEKKQVGKTTKLLYTAEEDLTVCYRFSVPTDDSDNPVYKYSNVYLVSGTEQVVRHKLRLNLDRDTICLTFNAKVGNTYMLTSTVNSGEDVTCTASLERAAEFVVDSGALVDYNGEGGVVNIPAYYKEHDKLDPKNPDAPVSETDPDALTVSEIVYTAFVGNQDLVAVNIPDTVSAISYRGLQGCDNLERVKLPRKLEVIGDATFSGDRKLNHVEVPENVYAIGRNAFQDCDSLDDITLPEGLTTICDYAFSGCDSLKEITIPMSIRHIGEHALGYLDFEWVWFDEEEFGDYVDSKREDFVIKGWRGTVAETYAAENGFRFIALGDAPEPKTGDVSGDNNVDVTDATLVQMIAAEVIVPSPEQIKAADVNNDNNVDVSDATLIQMYAAEVIDHF